MFFEIVSVGAFAVAESTRKFFVCTTVLDDISGGPLVPDFDLRRVCPLALLLLVRHIVFCLATKFALDLIRIRGGVVARGTSLMHCQKLGREATVNVDEER